MASNPILQIIADYLLSERRITAILIDNKLDPKELTFVFDKGKRERHKVESQSKTEFMRWWSGAIASLRIKWNKEAEAKKPAKKKSVKKKSKE
jgi:hypothetical protein